MKKITKATPAQWARIDEIRQWWIDEQTAQYDDETVRESCRAMWRAMGCTPDAVLVLDSPAACTVASAAMRLYSQLRSQLRSQLYSQLYNQLYNQLTSQLTSQLSSQLTSQLTSQLDSQLYSQLYNQLDSQLDSQLTSQLYSQLRSQLTSQLSSQLSSQFYSQLDSQLTSQLYSQLTSQLSSQLTSQLYSQLYNQLDSQLTSQLYSQPRYWSAWWQAWAGWYEGGVVLGVRYDSDRYDLFRRWCLHCTFCVPYQTIPIVSRRPVEVHWQDGRLHNESGMSVRYADGWGIWSIGGVAVDEQIVMRPETQTVEQIRGEENEEVKRIRIERFGWTRYLGESGANRVDSRRNDIEGTRESLYVTPDGLKTLMCVCPSTAKVFALEVDPSVESCEQAQLFLSSGLSSRIISAS